MTPDGNSAGPGRNIIRAALRRRALRRVLLSIWAFLTLVLIFCVILLAFEMVRQGQDPLAAVKNVDRQNNWAYEEPPSIRNALKHSRNSLA